MKKVLRALIALSLFALPVYADGPVCGTESNPSLKCPAVAPAPSLLEIVEEAALVSLNLIP